MGKHTNSGLGGFMSGASIRFSKMKGGGGVDAWRDQLAAAASSSRQATTRARTTGTKLPKLNTIHEGTVVAIQTFGAFVQLGDGTAYKDGLLHVSCIGAERVENPEEAGIALDMKLWVKVSDVNDGEGKYGVDIRYVNQNNGTDLDPYHSKGRLPNNFFVGKGKSAPSMPGAKPTFGSDFAWKDSIKPEASSTAAPSPSAPAGKEKKRKRKAKSDSSGDSDGIASGDVAEARAKANKKLEKARKKLEKAKKKAEKAKKKKEKKKEKKKAKKAKTASDDESDPCPSSSSSS